MTAMRKLTIAILFLAMSTFALTQDVRSAKMTDRSTVATTLGFEDQQGSDFPAGWSGGPEKTVFVEDKIVHSGQRAGLLVRQPDSPGGFSSLHKMIPVDFSGTEIELRGYLKSENVNEFAGIWMREDDEDGKAVEFDNMFSQKVQGTTEWKQYSIKLRLNPEARRLYFGAVLATQGKLWVDDLELLVDGKPIASAPKSEPPKTVLDTDHAFDNGSTLAFTSLSKTQIHNLATLGKVWGFLKYYHPKATSGQVHWDYELFRALPVVLQAPNQQAANQAIEKWIAGLGEVKPCNPCAQLVQWSLAAPLHTKWIEDRALLGEELSRTLKDIYDKRPLLEKTFYVVGNPGASNPTFQHEPEYRQIKLPDPGYQLLALFRFWNIVEYWYPYRDVIGEDWDAVLTEFIPRVALAKDKNAYKLELIQLIGRIHDTHANLWTGLDVRPPVGECRIPVRVRFIEGQAVVTGYVNAHTAETTGLHLGDVILSLDDVPTAKLVEQWSPFYTASNDGARLRDIGRAFTQGPCGDAKVEVRRESGPVKLQSKRLQVSADRTEFVHDMPGATFRLLSKDVAYLKLSSVKASEAGQYVKQAEGTRGLIIDIRNYPSEFMVFALGQLLVDKTTSFTRFTAFDLSTPGAFHWKDGPELKPEQPHYAGKVVILVDEVSLSQSEYTTMAFRAAPQTVVVGSTTSGADGNVSPFGLPGGERTGISGLGIFYPDKKPTQRVGIAPDVEVKPTIAGIRSGRDEVLEEGIRQIVGKNVTAEEMKQMTAR
jgi:C-terminal processing protease CtpA/Prc